MSPGWPDPKRDPTRRCKPVVEWPAAELTCALTNAEPAAATRLRPRLADLYRAKVARLEEELNRPELRAEAAEALRGMIDEIRLVPESSRLDIELVGNLSGLLLFASKNPRRTVPTGVQITMVAAEGYQREYPLLLMEI